PRLVSGRSPPSYAAARSGAAVVCFCVLLAKSLRALAPPAVAGAAQGEAAEVIAELARGRSLRALLPRPDMKPAGFAKFAAMPPPILRRKTLCLGARSELFLYPAVAPDDHVTALGQTERLR